VQGRLLGNPVTARIESRCAVCLAPIAIEVDQDLRWRTPGGTSSTPLILEPSVDWSRFAGPSILHDY
jgi:hypothetical protein